LTENSTFGNGIRAKIYITGRPFLEERDMSPCGTQRIWGWTIRLSGVTEY